MARVFGRGTPSDPHCFMGDRKRVEDGLAQIASLFGLSGRDGWKAAAYERGAEIVRALGDDQLEAMISADRLRDIDGIGPSLAKQIGALWRDGRSELLDRLEAQYPRGAAELARVPGMTVRRIRALGDALGIGSIAELRSACAAQRVRAVPGFGVKLEQKLSAGCEQIDAPPVHRRMLLVEAIATANRLREHLVSIAGVAEEVQLAGAARRGEESVDELELLVVTRDPDGSWAALARLGAVFALDRARSTAQLSAGIGLRLTVVPPQRAGAGLLTATGPRAHVQALEERARARGVALADVTADAPDAFAAEAAIYRTLDLAVTPPELRVDGGEAELSELGESRFAALVEAEHIRGLVHCHTEYSDGRDSVEAMARAAEALGMEYITITDHSPSAHYAGGVPLDRLKAAVGRDRARPGAGERPDPTRHRVRYPGGRQPRLPGLDPGAVRCGHCQRPFTLQARSGGDDPAAGPRDGTAHFQDLGPCAGTAAAVARSDPLRRAARARRACGEPGCCRDQRGSSSARSRARMDPPRRANAASGSSFRSMRTRPAASRSYPSASRWPGVAGSNAAKC